MIWFAEETEYSWPSVRSDDDCIVFIDDAYVNLVSAKTRLELSYAYDETVKLMREAWCV